MRRLRAAVVPVVLVALLALAGVVLDRIYADPLLLRLVAGAGAGAVLVGVAARRLPSWSAAPLSVVALAGYTVLALRLAAGHADLPGPWRALTVDALFNGIPRLLTAMIPVESAPDTVAVPVVAAWLAGLAGAELAVRGGRVLLGCLPAVLLYAGALYVVGPNAARAGWPTLIFAGLVALALVSSRRPVDEPAGHGVPAGTRARAVVTAGIGVAVTLALVAAVGPWVGGRVSATPVDPRRYVRPPQVDSLDESPLNRISGWALDPRQKLFDLRIGAGGDAGQRLRLAVLSDYDGVTWRVGATYRNAGRVLPAVPEPPGATSQRLRQEITIENLSGRLLPAVPTPTGVGGARVAYDPGTGTLIRPEGLFPVLRYTVDSSVQLPDPNLLPAADVPTGPATVRYLAIGAGVPESIQRLAGQLAEGNGGPYDRARAIEEFLGEHYRLVADAPSGHAYPNLAFFLFGARDRGGQRGTSEQFAAAFALLGRLAGLPTRVVVGFRAPAAGGAVTGGDAYAWPEVLFDGLGWVPFDPVPQDDAPPRPVEEDFVPKPPTQRPVSEPTPSVRDAPASAAPPAAAPAPRTDGPRVLVAVGASAALLLAAAATVVLLRRAQRRRRLTVGPPAARVAGAWLEFTDALRLAGHRVPAHLAATEVADFAAAPWAGGAHGQRPDAVGAQPAAPDALAALPPVDELAAGLNVSAFAPAGVDGQRAERAAAEAIAYAAALRAGLPRWRRAWWTVHPGPLRWHR